MRLSLKSLWIFLLWGSLLWIVELILMIIFKNSLPKMVYTAVILISAVFYIIYFYLVISMYRTFHLFISEQSLEITKGFILKRKHRVKIDSIISVKNISTPVMRLMKLKTTILILEGSVVFLPPLDFDIRMLYEKA